MIDLALQRWATVSTANGGRNDSFKVW